MTSDLRGVLHHHPRTLSDAPRNTAPQFMATKFTPFAPNQASGLYTVHKEAERSDSASTKYLLGGVGHVQETILVFVSGIDFRHGGGHVDQAAVAVNQKVEGLSRGDGHSVAAAHGEDIHQTS